MLFHLIILDSISYLFLLKLHFLILNKLVTYISLMYRTEPALNISM